MKLKKVLACLLSVLMVLSVIPMTVFAEAGVGFDNFKAVKTYTDDTFEDVEDDDWYAENVESVYEFGIMVGRSENSFVAEDNMTLAEAMTIAARLNAIYNTGKAEFAVTDPWYKAYTDYCKNAGIADLANDDPDEAVTRGKFADIFANALPKEALKEINEVDDGAIPDVKEDDTFGKAIYALYRAGVLVGNDKKGTFAPDSFIKRMEVAAIAGRMAVPGDRETITLKNEKSYTVLFDVNYDDKTPDEVTVADGETVAAPKDPTRTGYTFAGWYTAETGGKKFDFEKAITKDTTVYAHWTKVSSGGGGGGSSSSKKTIEKLLSTVDFPVETDLNNLTNDEDWRAGSGLYCFVLDVDNDGTVEKYLMLYDKKNMTSVSLPITASMKKSGSNYVLNLDDVKLVFETEGGKVVGVTISGLTEDCEVFNDKTFTAPEYKSMEEILATNPDVPTSEGSTAPANAWINANNNSFKAFLGVEEETDLFMFRHPTEFTWGIGMTESFLKDGDNYVFEDEINHVTFTVVMEDGMFTSVNIETENEKFKDMAGTYVAPVYETMESILATNPDIPTSEDDTAPAKAWINEDDPECKAFLHTGEPNMFQFTRKGNRALAVEMADSFLKVGDTYVLDGGSYGVFTCYMEDGKFTAIKHEKGDDTNAIYNGTYRAAETGTIGEILPKNFPQASDSSDVPENAWIAPSGYYCFLEEDGGENLVFGCNGGRAFALGLDTQVQHIGDAWMILEGENYVAFNMEDDVLASVTLSHGDDFDGTYGAPVRKTLGDILATIPGIPTSPDETVPEDAWTNMDNPDAKTFMGYNSASGSERLIFKDSERQYWLDMTDEFLCFDDQYVFNGRSSKTTLYVEDGEIVSIEIDMIDPEGESLSGVYAAKLPVEYMDWDGEKLIEKSTTEAIEVTDATTTLEAGKFYVVNGEVTTGNLTVQGTKENPTTLILADGAKLTVTGEEESAGISISRASALVITGQSGNTGELIANGGRYGAGIGGNDCCDNGNLTINGGVITANGGYYGAGIGGGDCSLGGVVTINGGAVTANGGYCGAGIGGGDEGDNGTVTINGGAVTANGGEYAAGIGGGDDGHGGTVTINDGSVTAKGQSRGAGIGGGNNGNGSIVTINGGTVTATGGDDGKAMGGDTFMDDGSVTFGKDMNFIIKAGDDKDSAKSMTAEEYAEDHSAKYIGIRGLTEPNTIADILDLFGTDLPITGDSGIPKGAWETEDGTKACYRYVSGSEDIFKATASDFTSLVSCSESVTQSGTDYVYAKGTITWTFAVTDKKITSITASGTSRFDGTYAPAPEKRDLGSIVSTVKDFPSNPEAGMPAPSNAWENENGQACYDYPMDYGFYGLAVGDIRLAFYKGWTAKGKDGVYSFTHDTGYTLIFTMQDNVLVSIEAKDSETSDGVYVPVPAGMTLAEIFNTNPDFPQNSGDAWENENGRTCFLLADPDAGGELCFCIAEGQYGLNYKALQVGDDYVWENNDTTHTFHMTENVLTSIEVSGTGGDDDGTYTAPGPVQDPVITLEVEGDGSGHFEDGWGQTVTSIEVPSGSLLYTQAEGTDPNNWFWIVNGDYIYAYRFVVDEGSEFTGWNPNYTEEDPFTVTADFTLRAKGK